MNDTEPENLPEATQDQFPKSFDNWIHPPLTGCLFLTGATGSGKTPLALAVAEELDAEIISLDSMAIYRGMDIGTAKPSRQQQQSIPHHMLDIVDPTEAFSVSSFVVETHRCARKILDSGKRVLVCGGTPLYLKSLIRGLFLGPEADWDFRNSIEEDLKRYGQDAMLARLAQVDPILADKLHPHDHRRIIRALEVAKHTGKPLSHWQEQFDIPADKTQFPSAVLSIDRTWLHQRINERVDSMLAAGLEAEVRSLLKKHETLGRTAAQAVGYREMIDYVEQKTSLEEASELIKAHTRQFARRQEIWFRGLTELQPIEVKPGKPMEEMVAEITAVFNAN
ncbi:MAG: tRNA (adenosine(37)-N6)-dimethylallyltransferase MiaA [Planctomycetota bacterium]